MSSARIWKASSLLSGPFSRPVLTIGNFDGVHLGHQRIIALALEKARSRGGTAVALTFRPHPQALFHPERALPLLTTYDEKIGLLGELGLDAVVEEPFSPEFANISPENFFREIVQRAIGAECVVVGYNFAFGKDRQGNLELLGAFCKSAGVELVIVPPFESEDGKVVSSSRIRKCLEERKVEEANALMGRKFFYRGEVIRGDRRGNQLGFPTANLKPEGKLLLPLGVYLTESVVSMGGSRQIFPSVTNVGVRPTFLAAKPEPVLQTWVETHLLDVSMDLYGSQLEVRFLRALRDEKKFPSREALIDQIHLDVSVAREAFQKMARESAPGQA